MLESKYFCDDFARQHRLLWVKLASRERTAFELVQGLSADELLNTDPEALAGQIASTPRVAEGDKVAELEPVLVGAPEFIQDIGIDAELRGVDFKEHIPCWRWTVQFAWSGPAEFGYWPDETGGELEVFDNHSQLGYPPTLKWQISKNYIKAFCYVASTENRSDHPEDLYQRAADHLSAYTKAFEAQVRSWYGRLQESLVESIREQQKLFGSGRQQRELLTQKFQEWRVGPLRPAIPTSPPARSGSGTVDVNRIVLELPSLPEAALDEVTKVVNRWVASIEKYPVAFHELEEERLSDLLVATLNGAFARAEREVFIGSGKSDFYVTSNSLGDDGNAEVFVGETKIWDGPSNLGDAITQTLDNLTRRTLSALLLIVVRDRKSFTDAMVAGRAAIASDERVLEEAPRIAGCSSHWVQSALDPRSQVRLITVWADLTKDAESGPKPKGRR